MTRRLVLVAALAAVFATPAQAATPLLHAGSAGPQVAKLQYLLRDPRPRQNVFTHVRGTFPHQANGYWGSRTSRAVVDYKFRIGYPLRLVKPIAGPYFFALLLGHKNRPLTWVALAARRLAAYNAAHSVVTTATPLEQRIENLLRSQVGIIEQPWGSNRGPHISEPFVQGGKFFHSFEWATGAYGTFWCASTMTWAFYYGGYGFYGYGRSSDAGVVNWKDYALHHGQIHAQAKQGALVAWLTGNGAGIHIGFVIAVGKDSSFTTIEGNSGNQVAIRYHTLATEAGRLHVFIWAPGVA